MSNWFTKTLSLARALLTGQDVSDERIQKRVEICTACELVVKHEDGLMSCGVCGCRLKGDRSLINLVRYEETPVYGCKHPKGSRWKESGV